MHNVQVLASLDLGESERVAAELAELSISAGHRRTVIATGHPSRGRPVGCGGALLERPAGRLRLPTMRHARQMRDWLATDRAVYRSRLPAGPA
jgi:hypothetical protein